MGHLAEVRMPENCTPDGCPTGLSDTAGGGLTAFSRIKSLRTSETMRRKKALRLEARAL